jgi:hypothetical protein
MEIKEITWVNDKKKREILIADHSDNSITLVFFL